LPVVASFSILGDFVREVGGDGVALSTIVGPNGDAHVYEPTPGDGRKLAGARLVFVNGLGFEGGSTGSSPPRKPERKSSRSAPASRRAGVTRGSTRTLGRTSPMRAVTSKTSATRLSPPTPRAQNCSRPMRPPISPGSTRSTARSQRR